MTLSVGVDLGKTGCRAKVLDRSRVHAHVEGPGARGLADAGGVEEAFDAVWSVVSRALGIRGDEASRGAAVNALAVGAAGAEAATGSAHRLAAMLRDRLPTCSVTVTSDSVTAHAGALGGRPGTVLAVGTGSVALGVSASGRLAQVDGWGPWLGDDGSGAWMGREALRAVLRSREGRGPATVLTDAAVRRFGDLSALPHALAGEGAVARTAASFVPEIIAAAEEGDPVAAAVTRRAARVWAELTVAAATAAGESLVVLVGGLTSASLVAQQWQRLLPDELRVEPARGTAVDGALLLASRSDLPHEARVVRLAAAGPDHAGHRQNGAAPGPGTATFDLDALATEQVRTDLTDLDCRRPEDLVRVLLEAEATVPEALMRAQTALAAAVRLAGDALDRGGRLVYVGAGTPGRLAALDAAECPPTFGTAPERVVAVLAGGAVAAGRAVEGAEDDGDAGAGDVLALDLTSRDLVVGITASGRTPYVLSALEAARGRGCPTVAVVNNPASPARLCADVTVELLTGSEVLSGSTRLKAGTAQKIALNVISTGAMVSHGKTYGAWMVDVVASNEKLRRRARRILREATGVGDAEALAMLQAAGWRTKTALVAILADVDASEAQRLLDAASGRVRLALAANQPPGGPR